jgi:SH3-like domain-containing protein
VSEEILGRIREWCAADPTLEFGEGDPPTITLTEDTPIVFRLVATDDGATLSHTAQNGEELTRSLGADAARFGFMGAVYDLAAAAAQIAAASESEPAEEAREQEPESEPEQQPEPEPQPEAAVFVATHRVPDGGMTAWSVPDGTTTPIATLAARVELRVDEERGGWAKVVGSNGWTGWVDGRRLEPIAVRPEPEPEPEPEPQPEAEPEPQLQPEPQPQPVVQAQPAAPVTPAAPAVFTPTHRVPAGGLAAWSAPDPAQQPVANLEARVELRVDEMRGAWAKVVGSNGWTGWVDGRRLEGIGSAAPGFAAPGAAARPAGAGIRLADLPVLALAGVAALIVAAFLPWVQGFANNSLDWPIQSLWSSDDLIARVFGDDVGALTVGIVVLVLAAAGLAGAVLPQVPVSAVRIVGVVTIVVAALFALQLMLGIQDLGGTFGDALTDGVNVGVWVALGGGVLMLVGSRST